MNMQITQPLRYDIPSDVNFKRVIELLQENGYTPTEIGHAIGYGSDDPTWCVTRLMRGNRQMTYKRGAQLLALAEDTLSVRELGECVSDIGYKPHARPPKKDLGVDAKWPTSIDTSGLVKALQARRIQLKHIAHKCNTVQSTMTMAVARKGHMSTPVTLRLLAYAQRVLAPDEFSKHVSYEEIE